MAIYEEYQKYFTADAPLLHFHFFVLLKCTMVHVFPQQQNAKGSLHNIDFGVFWASWDGSGKELGSGNRFRVTGFAVPGTSSGNRLRVSMVPTGFAVPRFRAQFSGNRVPDPRHCQGFGFRRLRARRFEGFGVR